MAYCAEIVSFSMNDDEEEFARLRKAAIDEVKAAHPDFVSAPYAGKREDGTWVDLWIYKSREAADAANDDIENLHEFLKMFALLENVNIEFITVPEGTVELVVS